MAKRGLVYYLSIGAGLGFVTYMFYANRNSSKKEDLEKLYLDPETNTRPPTPNEIRLMGERKKVESVPHSDSKSGYM